MRKHARPVTPNILQLNGTRCNDQYVALKTRNPRAQFEWYTIEGRTIRDWILEDLRAITQGHCAFCDTFPLDDRLKVPIEYFRPKSRPEFYHLAYEWTNLYYCCGFCQTEKGEQWSDLILCADAADYDFGRYFQYDFTTGAIMPNENAIDSDRAKAIATIEVYGFDKPEKRRARMQYLRQWTRDRERILDEFPYRDFVAGPI